MSNEETIESLKAQLEEEKQESERLRKHNGKLLSEKKEATSSAEESAEKVQALESELSGYRDAPIHEALGSIALEGMSGYLKDELEKTHTIRDGENGPEIADSDGKPVADLTIKGVRHIAEQTGNTALSSLLYETHQRPVGAGQTGDKGLYDGSPKPKEPAEPKPQFGLQ